MNLETRIERLERGDRRWRLAATVAGAGLALVVFMGQARPEPGEVKARKFVLVDDEGTSRATLAMEAGGPSLVLTDARGRGAIRLSVPKVPDKGTLYLSDGEARSDLELAMTQNGPVIHLNDKRGNRVRLATNELNAPLAAVYDEEGKLLFQVTAKK
ncbi:MAG TPA: hypothetical protein VFB96_26620 [Pirellulaceae bacterium]|nr:hypothetical protein [Pirellulaceae bacterium]